MRNKYLGSICVTISAIFFSLATLFVKIITTHSSVSAIEITFFRFLLGFIVTGLFIGLKQKTLRPKRTSYVLLRALSNTAAVIFFFMGVQHTTITNANLLNMTYPVFVFLFSPFITRERTPGYYYFFLLLALSGTFIIIGYTPHLMHAGDIFSLVSAILAGLAISFLRQTRKYDDTYLILFYLMAIGTIITFFLMLPSFVMPAGYLSIVCFCAASSAVLGQLFITIGYRFISAAAGSLIGTSRVFFAAFLGIMFLSEKLSINLFIGGLLIILSLFGVTGIFQSNLKKPKKNLSH